jgi:hypothetical protein
MMHRTLVELFSLPLLVFGQRTGPLEIAKNHALHERLVDKDLG